jgi:quinol monooxygenase YgiN
MSESSTPFTLVVNLKVKAGREAEFKKFAANLTESSLAEGPGCQRYVFFEAADDPGSFVLVEQWRDAAAYKAHGARLVRDYGPPPAGQQGLPERLISFFDKVEIRKAHEIVVGGARP